MTGVRYTALIICSFLVVCESELSGPEGMEESHGSKSTGPSRLIHLTPHLAFQLINDSLEYSRAESFCRSQFSSLATLEKSEEQEGVIQLLQQYGVHSPIWLRDPSKAASKSIAFARQYVEVPALNFPKESSEGFVRVNMTFPALSSVSVCVRVQWDPDWNEVSTIFSYAAPVFTNEFQLRGQVDIQRRILLALIIHGKHLPYKASFVNDGEWHHICVTWHRSSSQWAIYVDGERKDTGSGTNTSEDIHGDGILILGQDQDSFGGSFTEPFVGNITDLNVWNMSLETKHVNALNACSPMAKEALFTWNLDNLSSHPVVREVKALLLCPASHQWRELQGCRMLQSWSDELPLFDFTDCSDVLPFICRSSKESYLKMKQMSDSQSSQPTTFMSHLMKLSNQTQVLEQPLLNQQLSRVHNISQVSALLDISVQALEDTQQDGLQPVDMVSLIQLLSLAADIPSQPFSHATNYSQESIQELTQHFVKVADSIINEDNTNKWQAIREVVNGPMDVIKCIDRMVTSLSPQLMAETDHLIIHHPNIKLEVQSLLKNPGASTFCGPKTETNMPIDCISVPHQKMQDLHTKVYNYLPFRSDSSGENYRVLPSRRAQALSYTLLYSVQTCFPWNDKGSLADGQDTSCPSARLASLQRMTLVNTWYGSLRPLFNPEENITIVPTVTDGSQRYLGTVLGSSVISTTVLGDDQPVSMAVRFQLQHRVQNPTGTAYEPVCAFWDFDVIPEAGGWWNTKGCEVVSKQYGYTVCYCNHTTNFALLLQVYEVQRSPENEKALQVLTFIGCGVSLCGLLFTFVLFIAVGVPKSDRTTVHKNLIVALGVAELLLMCSDWASDNEAACFAVTALLHLFFMASFSWMLVEGVLLWSKVVSVNISEDSRMKLYYVIGWGLPVLIVGVTLAVSVENYRADDQCWLSVTTDTIWAFVGPVIFILAVNAVVLCRVVMVTVSSAHRRAKMLSPSSASKIQTFDLTWAVTRPVLILLPVLGLTWLCGVLVHLSVVVAYLFIALNAFQGLYIFLVYAVYNSEVRNAIKRIKEKRKALSFMNCSQPTRFLPSQRAPATSWGRSPPTPSSPETSETYGPVSSTSTSLVIKNESFRKEGFVSFSLKPASGKQVVQLTGFRPSGC